MCQITTESNNMIKSVLIMLSTYNGHEYLQEQLDSLYQQKDVDIHILVRDDGSKDNTVEILKTYQHKYGKMTIHADENIGAAKSFHTLMSYAYCEYPNYDYYAFSDQDDVWLEDKLFIATQQISENNGDLYYCNAIITDSNLNKIENLGCKRNLSLQYLMFRQPALGCTQVMTKKYFSLCTELFKDYIKHNPPLIELHDVWTMWISQMIGINVVVDEEAHMLYRQHGNNVTTHNQESVLQKIRRVSKRSQEHKGYTYSNLKILGELLRDRLTYSAKDALNRLYDYKSSILKTLSFAFYMQRYFKSLSIKAMVIYRIIYRLY